MWHIAYVTFSGLFFAFCVGSILERSTNLGNIWRYPIFRRSHRTWSFSALPSAAPLSSFAPSQMGPLSVPSISIGNAIKRQPWGHPPMITMMLREMSRAVLKDPNWKDPRQSSNYISVTTQIFVHLRAGWTIDGRRRPSVHRCPNSFVAIPLGSLFSREVTKIANAVR